MPLYKTIHINADIVLHIWKITESEEDLHRNVELTERCNKRVEGMKSGLHRRGFLSIRQLMLLEGYVDSDLYYDELGKPHLHDGNHISISHSFEFTGIIISRKQRVGIDIEKQRPKIVRIAHKFTTLPIQDGGQEQEILVRKLTKIWGAKESLYKISPILGLSFLQNIFIETEFNHKRWFSGEINVDDIHSEFTISHLEFEGFTCVYALKE